MNKNPLSGASAAPGTIPAPMPRTRPGVFEVGVDGAAGSLADLDWAVAKARLRGAAVQAVIAWERITGRGATNDWAIGVGGPPDDTGPVLARAVTVVARLGKRP